MKLRLRLGKGFSLGSSGARYHGSGFGGFLIASFVSLVAILVIGPFIVIGKLFGRDRR